MPEVSIIIPVHNTVKYLEECINSAVSQTLNDIEIILVDDNSTDGSRDIIRSFASRDERIKTLFFDENVGTLRARKEGVRMSTGSYVCFMDSDDHLDPEAMALAVEKMRIEKVDILHYSVLVVNCNNATEKRIAMNQRIAGSYPGRLEGKDVFTVCFVDRQYGFQLWSKLFNGDFCRRTMERLDDVYMPKAQDGYTYFVLSYCAESYYGWECKPLYYYCFGRGVTGPSRADLDKLERYCAMRITYDHMLKFCSEHQDDEVDLNSILQRFKDQWIGEAVKMVEEISDDEAGKAMDILSSYWPVNEIAGAFTRVYWGKHAIAGRYISRIDHTEIRDKDIRVIGLYYHRMSLGGAQKVVYLMGCMLVKMGYKVVVITDEEPTPLDYVVPDAERLIIQPTAITNKTNYTARASMWNRIIDDNHIDLLIFNAWASEMLIWDTFLFRMKDVSVISYNHNVFSYSLLSISRSFASRTYAMSLVDSIIVLSEADRVFWSTFNDNVYHLPNPIDKPLRDLDLTDEHKEKSIVWVARLSKEKRPMDAISIMEQVVQKVPDAILYMVGDSPDGKQLEAIRNRIEQLGLTENIKLTGFTNAPGEYYARSQVFLSTSKYEGYPMVLIEAEAYGLPVVMYDIYHLDLNKDEFGVTRVPYNDTASAAEGIIRLLSDEGYYSDRCKAAKDAFIKLCSFDLEGAWDDVLHGRSRDGSIDIPTRDMIRLIRDHYDDGWTLWDKKIKKLKKENDELNGRLKSTEAENVIIIRENESLKKQNRKSDKELRDIRNSTTYRLAKSLSKPFRMIKKRMKGKK